MRIFSDEDLTSDEEITSSENNDLKSVHQDFQEHLSIVGPNMNIEKFIVETQDENLWKCYLCRDDFALKPIKNQDMKQCTKSTFTQEDLK